MTTQEKRLLQAKIFVALLTELGRQPTKEEVERFSLAARVLYKTILGLHYERQGQKETGQLAIFQGRHTTYAYWLRPSLNH